MCGGLCVLCLGAYCAHASLCVVFVFVLVRTVFGFRSRVAYPRIRFPCDELDAQDDFMEIFSPPRMCPEFTQLGYTANLSADVLTGCDPKGRRANLILDRKPSGNRVSDRSSKLLDSLI
jgi:hypothetical protein